MEVVTNLLVNDFLSPYATEALSVLLASSFCDSYGRINTSFIVGHSFCFAFRNDFFDRVVESFSCVL